MSLEAFKRVLDANNKTLHENSGEATSHTSPVCQYDLSFLYCRESDRIGEGITDSSDFLLSHVMEEKEANSLAIKRGRGLRSVVEREQEVGMASRVPEPDEIQKTLDSYKHSPRVQNPLYTTTSNEFGLKKPSAATFSNARQARSQKFSNSFNRMTFRDQGLNTSMTKSKIHVQFDAQFA